jgi:hypothetical protein
MYGSQDLRSFTRTLEIRCEIRLQDLLRVSVHCGRTETCVPLSVEYGRITSTCEVISEAVQCNLLQLNHWA